MSGNSSGESGRIKEHAEREKAESSTGRIYGEQRLDL